MKLKTLCGIFGIGLISLTASAQDSLFRKSYLNHLKKLEKYTPVTKQEIQSNTNRFNMINSGLKEYNFFTKEEHEKLSKNLGSLNYLLKEKK